MNLSKEQLCFYLGKLDVNYDKRLNEKSLERLLRQELKNKGLKLRAGELYRDAIEKDLEKNPELKEQGIKVGEEMGLGKLEDVLGKMPEASAEPASPAEEAKLEDKENAKPSEETTEPVAPAVNEEDKKSELKPGEYVMKLNVKHNGEAYKKDQKVALDKETAKLFLSKGWA